MRIPPFVPLVALAAALTVAALAQTGPTAAPPAATPPAGPATITIDATAPRTPVSPELYGVFFEEISHAGEGGLNAELVQNRDFEAATIPQGWTVDGDTLTTPFGWKTNVWFDNPIPAWSLVKEGDADGSMALDTVGPLNPRNPHALRFTITSLGTGAGRIGVANSGFWGMNIREGEWYDATFYARREGGARGGGAGLGLVFSLESADGKTVCARTTLPEIGRGGIGAPAPAGSGQGWARYTLTLHAHHSDPKARMVISSVEPGTVWLDCVSLMPRNTYKNHGLRPDLAQMVADLKPAFVRFPGGCIVEGVTLHNRIRWQDSIGDMSQRQGDYELWGYYNTYALGFREYLQFCEDLGAAPLYVVNAGLSCQLRRPYELATDADLHLYIEDALAALDYAMAPVTTEWGAKRAANGHPTPFKIKYVEIGNENWGANYEQHNYRLFYDAIKAKYPDVITIADTRIFQQPVEFVDDHYYVAPPHFFELANFYDSADRKGPKIYVGEYAVNRDVGSGNLLGALAEAVFTMNMEKNSDIVRMCSYAPLFENVNKADWPVNLIRFDSSRVIGRSSYYVQKLFANNRPDVVLKADVQCGDWKLVTTQVKDLYAEAGLDQKAGQLILKVVNPSPRKVTANIALKGLTRAAGQAHIATLSNPDPKADNTLDSPTAVVPVESQQNIPAPNFSYDFAPDSLTIIRLPAQ